MTKRIEGRERACWERRERSEGGDEKCKWQAWMRDGKGRKRRSERKLEKRGQWGRGGKHILITPSENGRRGEELTPCSDWMSGTASPLHTFIPQTSIPAQHHTGGYKSALRLAFACGKAAIPSQFVGAHSRVNLGCVSAPVRGLFFGMWTSLGDKVARIWSWGFPLWWQFGVCWHHGMYHQCGSVEGTAIPPGEELWLHQGGSGASGFRGRRGNIQSQEISFVDSHYCAGKEPPLNAFLFLSLFCITNNNFIFPVCHVVKLVYYSCMHT